MRVYFAGSIKGGRTFAGGYLRIVEEIEKQGHSVLGAHTASSNPTAREPAPHLVYRRDMRWLLSANAVVAEVSQPSLGVGYEIGTAVQRGIPVLCLCRADQGLERVSFMISGNTAPLLRLRVYDAGSLSRTIRTFCRWACGARISGEKPSPVRRRLR